MVVTQTARETDDRPPPTKKRRLHITGFPHEEDLHDRFSSFGTVHQIEGLEKLDANGRALKYAFVELESKEVEYKRCRWPPD